MSPLPTADEDYGLEPGGRIIHECGSTRMGRIRTAPCSTSGVRRTRRRTCLCATAVRSCSQADKNATWTILALAMRTSEYIAEQRKQGSI